MKSINIFNIAIFILAVISSKVCAQPVALDPTFGENGMTKFPFDGYSFLYDFDKNENIIAIGEMRKLGITGTFIAVVKTNEDGIIDQSFGNSGIVELKHLKLKDFVAYNFKITGSNKIFIFGNCRTEDGRRGFFVQLNEDGSLDETFGDNGVIILDSFGNTISLLNFETDDYLLFYNPPSTIEKYNYNGEIDKNFGENGAVHLTIGDAFIEPHTVKILRDESILVAGTGYGFTGFVSTELALCKLAQDGKFVTDFADNGIWVMDIIEEWPYYCCHAIEYFEDFIEDINGNLIVLAKIYLDCEGPVAGDFTIPIFVYNFNSAGVQNSDFGIDGLFSYYYYPKNYLGVQNMIPYNDNYLIEFEGSKIISINSNGTLDSTFNNTGMVVIDGFYTRNITLQGGDKLILCGANYLIRIILPPKTSIKQNNIDNFITIFPNPTTGGLRIQEFKCSRVQRVEVYDIYGRKQSYVSSVTCNEIDISHLRAGVYFVKIETDAGEVVKKVVIQ